MSINKVFNAFNDLHLLHSLKKITFCPSGRTNKDSNILYFIFSTNRASVMVLARIMDFLNRINLGYFLIWKPPLGACLSPCSSERSKNISTLLERCLRWIV